MGVQRLVMGVFFVALSACAIAPTAALLKASSAVESAERAEADKFAIYEITKAREYLHKAREEYGYADYEVAELYAKESVAWGDRAREKARDRPTGSTVAPPSEPSIVPPTPGGPIRSSESQTIGTEPPTIIRSNDPPPQQQSGP